MRMRYKIIPELTKKQVIELHRELWREIAHECKTNGRFKKYYVLEKLGYNPNDIVYFCWLCEYVWQKCSCSFKAFNCEKCPLVWEEFEDHNIHKKSCPCMKSYYGKFLDLIDADDMDTEAITELALKIAELPEKEEK